MTGLLDFYLAPQETEIIRTDCTCTFWTLLGLLIGDEPIAGTAGIEPVVPVPDGAEALAFSRRPVTSTSCPTCFSSSVESPSSAYDDPDPALAVVDPDVAVAEVPLAPAPILALARTNLLEAVTPGTPGVVALAATLAGSLCRHPVTVTVSRLDWPVGLPLVD